MRHRATGAPPAARTGGRDLRGRLVTAAATVLVLLPLAVAAPRPAVAASGVRVAVTSQTPAIGTVGSTLRVTGTVSNTGRQVLRHAAVRLRLSDTRLGSRAELAAVMAGEVTSRDGQVVTEVALPDLRPGSSAPFDLGQALDQVPTLDEFGVYALGVEVVGVRGGTTNDPGRVALVRSLLPWSPPTPGLNPTGFSWVWPLVDAPVRLASGLFANDRLARSLAPGGRLDRLLQAGIALDQGAAVTWAVDPELLETVRDMADGYDVVATDRDATVPGGGSGLARSWLEQLQAVTAGAPVLPLPYGDPDVVALIRHGNPADVARARSSGTDVVAGLLPGADLTPEIAWPPDGYLDRGTLGALVRDGATSVLLDGRALPATIDLSYTPSGRGRLSSAAGPVAGLLADPGLADLLAAAPSGADGSALAAERVVAETAMIAAELPSTGTSRTVVAMPPRRWSPSQTYLDQLVPVGTAAWAAPVGLRELAADPLPEVDRARLSYPRAQRRAELPESSLLALDTYRSKIALFASILTDRTRLVPGLQDSHLRLASTYWRGRGEARANRFSREQTYLTDLQSSVRVQPGDFTFGSRSGKIPVTLINDLGQAVNVVLRLDPQTPRLELQDVEVPPIGPNQKIQVEVPASAVAGGLVVVEASLRTPGGAPYSQPVALRVRVTEIGTVALVITIGAAVVLFLAAGVRVVRRLRRTDPDDPDEPDDPSAAPTGATADVTA
jgi:hypothetical protein